MSTNIICIIGGNGYVGSSVARHAIKAGLKVYCGIEVLLKNIK